MTSSDITLVKDSFLRLVPIADQVAFLFYARLFELNPQLRTFFAGDMAEQGRRLMAMVARTLAALERPETIITALHELDAYHFDHDADGEVASSVTAAWLWTMEKELGSEFTPHVRGAWITAFIVVTRTLDDSNRDAALAA